ncbi:hypothetical protein HP456_24210 [Bacillus haikouensis]|uniref:hypothetical protein n=1 Tax=Bacillus haikouensis TaxID=1510468 RepID=UPI0015561D22|nr:hypothetical protein [Bacillus haikouensis]NQD68994.1 hypothetical protein [Bacillus haikouensis]
MHLAIIDSCDGWIMGFDPSVYGFFNIPIIVILLVGIFSKRIPAIAAKTVIILRVFTYYMLVWGTGHLFCFAIEINFIHIYGILFAAETALMVLVGIWKPMVKPYEYRYNPKVDMMPWKWSIPSCVFLLACVAVTYFLFSPIGLAYEAGIISPWFWPAAGAVLLVTVILIYTALKSWNRKYAAYLLRNRFYKLKRKKNTLKSLQPSYYKIESK